MTPIEMVWSKTQVHAMRNPTILRRDDPPEVFPSVEEALASPDGLLCIGGDLSSPRLLAAYRRGIFPWYSEGQPILWWSPDPRCYFETERIRIPRGVRRGLRDLDALTLHIDTDFDGVVSQCAQARYPGDGTWITADMQHAYGQLHEAGHAHSVEVRDEGRLIAGLYGVAIGGLFAAESMFGQRSGVSRLALLATLAHMREHELPLMDCQLPSGHLTRLGAKLRSRSEFLHALQAAVRVQPLAGSWQRGPLHLAADPRE
jgi:leucyl/phenylalanyl-tRNA---protein transferase